MRGIGGTGVLACALRISVVPGWVRSDGARAGECAGRREVFSEHERVCEFHAAVESDGGGGIGSAERRPIAGGREQSEIGRAACRESVENSVGQGSRGTWRSRFRTTVR